MTEHFRKVWFNGKIEKEGPLIGVTDRGFLLGDGVFETLLLKHGYPAFWEEHIERLQVGLRALDFTTIQNVRWKADLKELWCANGFESDFGIARITVSRGEGLRGLATEGTEPTVLMTVQETTGHSQDEYRVMLSSYGKFSSAYHNRFKSTSGYMENILAKRQAQKVGFDDALLCNENEHLVCATSANIFLLDRDGALHTPSLEDGALPGVVRAIVIGLARREGIAVWERSILPDELQGASLMMTNSLIGLQRVRFGDSSTVMHVDIFSMLRSAYEGHLKKEFS